MGIDTYKKHKKQSPSIPHKAPMRYILSTLLHNINTSQHAKHDID